MSNKNQIVAVVLTRNRLNILEQCLESIQSQEETCDIIIVDNASDDGTEDMIKDSFQGDGIHYYNTGANLGSAGGFSFGVKQAVLLGYDYIWIMDDDVIPDKNALQELMQADKKLGGNWGCLSSFSYWRDGSVCKANRQKKGLFTFFRDSDYEKDLVPAKIVAFASMLVKRSAVEDVGIPIADYFFYTDDYEFSMRISSKYPTYVVPSSRVLHAMPVNTKASLLTDPPEKLWRYKYLYRNDMHCYRRFGFKGWLYVRFKQVYTFLQILIFEKNKEIKQEKINILCDAVREGHTFEPEIEIVRYDG